MSIKVFNHCVGPISVTTGSDATCERLATHLVNMDNGWFGFIGGVEGRSKRRTQFLQIYKDVHGNGAADVRRCILEQADLLDIKVITIDQLHLKTTPVPHKCPKLASGEDCRPCRAALARKARGEKVPLGFDRHQIDAEIGAP